MRRREDPEPDLAVPLGLGLTVILFAWLVPASTTLLHDGFVPPLIETLRGMAQLISSGSFANPRAAFAPELAAHMPGGAIWWAPPGAGVLVLGAVARKLWLFIDVRRSRTVLGRKSFWLAGSRPRSWARPRDLRQLIVRRRRPNRFTLGRLDGHLLASDPEAHVAVVAPTRSGKTTRYVIPWLLEHRGPAIVTSTKTDVLRATRRWRAKRGDVLVWDPFGPQSATWSPLVGCEDWSIALRKAQWLADAAQEGDSEIASYWRGEAARLLAPLLHAAALDTEPVATVLHWLDGQLTDRPTRILREAHADPALYQFGGIQRLDGRNKGSVYMSASSLLAAYRFPEVARSAASSEITDDRFFDGRPNTLYVVASSRQQRLIAPLVVAMLSSLLHTAAERANAARPLDPTLRVLLDEAANIAPIRDLPVHLSQASAHGVRIATMWQSLAQIRHRYGVAADDILANSTAKIYLGPVTDGATNDHLRTLLGDELVEPRLVEGMFRRREAGTQPVWRQRAASSAIQQLVRDRALLVEGSSPPAVLGLKAWWKAPRLRWRGQR